MGKRFHWRFETVKQAKEREEDRRKEQLAEARNVLRSEQEDLDRLNALKKEQSIRLRQKQTGKLDARDMTATHAYIQDLDEKIKAQATKLESAARAVEKRREDLVKSVQENRVLERLREKDQENHNRDERRREQAAMDETANTRSARSRRES